MTGSKYSAVRRSIARLLASQNGRAALARNNYESGTPVVPAIEDEPLNHFYQRIDQATGSRQSAVAAVLIDSQLHMARVTPTESNEVDTLTGSTRESVTVDPKTTVGMLFTMLTRHKQLGVVTQPFDYGKDPKIAVPFEMPERGDSLQSA